ncbi:MAG: hypothetical protein JSW71_15105, partial [Gemmatimonadota bacterium]
MIGTTTGSSPSQIRGLTITRLLVASIGASVSLLASPIDGQAQRGGGEDDNQELPSIEEKTAGMLNIDGLLPLYWDADQGHL